MASGVQGVVSCKGSKIRDATIALIPLKLQGASFQGEPVFSFITLTKMVVM